MAAAEPAARRIAPATPRTFEAFDRFFGVGEAAVGGEVEAGFFRDVVRLLEGRAAAAFFGPVFRFEEDVDLEAGLFADDFLAEGFAAGLRAALEDEFFADDFPPGDFVGGDFLDAALVGADFRDAGFFEGDFLEDDFFTPPARFLPPAFLELAAMWNLPASEPAATGAGCRSKILGARPAVHAGHCRAAGTRLLAHNRARF